MERLHLVGQVVGEMGVVVGRRGPAGRGVAGRFDAAAGGRREQWRQAGLGVVVMVVVMELLVLVLGGGYGPSGGRGGARGFLLGGRLGRLFPSGGQRGGGEHRHRFGVF